MATKVWKGLPIAAQDLDLCKYRLHHSLEWDASTDELLIFGGVDVNEGKEEGLCLQRLKFI